MRPIRTGAGPPDTARRLPVTVLFGRGASRVERLRRPAQVARDERDLSLGDNTVRGYGLLRAEVRAARRNNAFARRRSPSCASRRREARAPAVVAQGDPLQGTEGITRRRARAAAVISESIEPSHCPPARDSGRLDYLTANNLVSRKRTMKAPQEGAKSDEQE
jgi:hypothetical protein